LLSLADLSLLLNRSITTVRGYIMDHFEQTGELLPLKGYVLDQGSQPTHKGVILRWYEKGIAPPDIARLTEHSLEAVDRYIKDYERVKLLLRKGLHVREISRAIGRGLRTVLQYRRIVCEFHPDLVPAAQEEGSWICGLLCPSGYNSPLRSELPTDVIRQIHSPYFCGCHPHHWRPEVFPNCKWHLLRSRRTRDHDRR
jgi:hypothetical protein